MPSQEKAVLVESSFVQNVMEVRVTPVRAISAPLVLRQA
jgi:hypothetical protein